MFGVTGLHLNQINLEAEENLNRWKNNFNHYLWLSCWIAGHLAGGAIIFGITGGLGSIFSTRIFPASILILGIGCGLGALHQFKVFQLPMPQLNRQVSRLWLAHLNRNLTAFGYGLQLGSGLATRIKVITTYVVFGCAFLSGSFVEGVIIGAVFGLARAIIPVVLAPFSIYPDKSFSIALKFNSFENTVRKFNGITLITIGIGLFYFAYFA
jgi:hypothetical protein